MGEPELVTAEFLIFWKSTIYFNPLSGIGVSFTDVEKSLCTVGMDCSVCF